MILVELLKAAWMGIYGGAKIFIASLPAIYDLYKTINEIKSFFSWEGILQYGFGVPGIVVTILAGIVTVAPLVYKYVKSHF